MKKLFVLILSFMFLGLVSCVNTNPKVKTETKEITKDTITNDWFCRSIEVEPTKTTRAVGAKGKFWPVGTVLRVGFIGGNASQIAAVKQFAPEWTKYANLKFDFSPSQSYDIRVSFNASGGAWSYVGTDCKYVSQNNPTMNLGWIGRDVICHEFGHTLGLFHEHQNPNGGICFNEANVISDLSGPPNNWSIPTIRFNVLDKLDANSVLTSAWDQRSVMHYPIRASWTCNNVAIQGGAVISQGDIDFIKLRYPGAVPPSSDVTLSSLQIDNIIALLNARQTEADSNLARIKRSNSQIKTILKRQ